MKVTEAIFSIKFRLEESKSWFILGFFYVSVNQVPVVLGDKMQLEMRIRSTHFDSNSIELPLIVLILVSSISRVVYHFNFVI